MHRQAAPADMLRIERAYAARWLRVGLTICFALLTAIAAQVSVWIGPVPITLQTAVVLLAGAVLGPAAGAASQALYLMMGIGGLPVFAGAIGGLVHLAGPTGGYLVAFVPAAAAVGLIAGGPRGGIVRLVAAIAAGKAIVLACGAAWLVAGMKMDVVAAVATGVTPFVPGAIAKWAMVVAATMMWRGSGAARLVERERGRTE